MSLVSIYKNKDNIAKFFQHLNDTNDIENVDSKEYITKIISDCLIKQYEMMRKYLNINAINKRHFDKDLCGEKLLDAWYQHVFTHNYTALNDEYFEIFDAVNKLRKNRALLEIELHNTESITIAKEVAIEKTNDAINMSRLLIIEEIIDAFHFVLEYVILIEEAYRLTILVDKKDITVESLEYFFIDCSENNLFYTDMNEMLNKEASHIVSYILDQKNIDNFCNSCMDVSDAESLIFQNIRINRDLVRETNFKDWKKYEFRNHFTQMKFANMFMYTRNMFMGIQFMIQYLTENFSSMFGMIFPSNDKIFDTLEQYGIDEDDYCDIYFNNMYNIVYSVYLAKREENIRRQGAGDITKADPRYYSDGSGDIVGDSVK